MLKRSFWSRPQAFVLAAGLAVGIGGAGLASGRLGAPALALSVASQDQAPSGTGFAPPGIRRHILLASN